jgi:hypothetical protein
LTCFDLCDACSGKEIDQHDMVLRFNSAPTHGFERLVGSKTTHRITNTQNWVFRESDSEHIMVHMRSTSSLTAVIRTHMVWGPPRRASLSNYEFAAFGRCLSGWLIYAGRQEGQARSV